MVIVNFNIFFTNKTPGIRSFFSEQQMLHFLQGFLLKQYQDRTLMIQFLYMQYFQPQSKQN